MNTLPLPSLRRAAVLPLLALLLQGAWPLVGASAEEENPSAPPAETATPPAAVEAPAAEPAPAPPAEAAQPSAEAASMSPQPAAEPADTPSAPEATPPPADVERSSPPAEPSAPPNPPLPAAPPPPPPAPEAPAAEPEPPASRNRHEIVSVGSDSYLKVDERCSQMVTVFGHSQADGEVHGDYVTVFGNAVMNGSVRGQSVAVLGDLTVNGPIYGQAVCIGGTLTLGPKAVIHGQMVSVGGSVAADPLAVVQGQRVKVPFMISLKWIGDWMRDGLFRLCLLPYQHRWAWSMAVVFIVINFLFYLLFRRPVDATAEVLERKPAMSLLNGIVATLLFGPVIVLLAVTVIGAVLIPFLFVAVMIASFVGTVAIYRYCGSQLGLRAQPALAVLLGNVVFTAIYAVPVLSLLVWMVSGLVGFGAAVTALIERMRRESRNGKSRPAPVTRPAAVAAVAPAIPGAAPAGPGAVNSVVESAAAAEAPAALLAAGLPAADIADRVGFWPRFGASCVDLIIVAPLSAFLGMWLWWVPGDSSMFPLLWIAYHFGFWAWKGTTVGGHILNLRIVRLDGRRMDFPVAGVRVLGAVLSMVPMFLGFMWASWDEDRQAWHDKIAGTTVVRVPPGQPLF